MKKILIIGGNSGLGLSLAINFLDFTNEIIIVGKDDIKDKDIPVAIKNRLNNRIKFIKYNLLSNDLSIFDNLQDIDSLIITAGFGRVALFEDLTEPEVSNLMKVNMESIIKIINKYYHKINSNNDFYTAVIGSIAGHIASPYFSVYGAAKAGLCQFIQNINVELAAKGYKNRILDVSPGSLKGTAFNGGNNDVYLLLEVSKEIINKMLNRETLWIPQYKEIYSNILEKNHKNPIEFGIESYYYKKNSGRISNKPQVTIGYISGTFDLFHIGHLNILKRAKANCDYLIVGVHPSAAHKGKETFIPFDERKQIVEGCRYVDKVVEATPEDSENVLKYGCHRLFVGSDYRGTDRFNRYEEMFKDKGIEVVYFPYTKSTSSTQIRENIIKKNSK